MQWARLSHWGRRQTGRWSACMTCLFDRCLQVQISFQLRHFAIVESGVRQGQEPVAMTCFRLEAAGKKEAKWECWTTHC